MDYKTIEEHTFKRQKDTYLFPKYVRDDGKYYIQCSAATGKFKAYECETGKEVGCFDRLKEAKIFFGVSKKN